MQPGNEEESLLTPVGRSDQPGKRSKRLANPLAPTGGAG
jgi:hypothetical protein